MMVPVKTATVEVKKTEAIFGVVRVPLDALAVLAALLFSFPYTELKLQYEKACEAVGIVDQSLYRLRHGGASHDRATKRACTPPENQAALAKAFKGIPYEDNHTHK